MYDTRPLSKVFQPNVMLQIFFQQFSQIHECYDQEEETGGSVDIMTQNFLINTSNSYYDPKLPTVSPGNCSHMKCHHLLPVLQEYQVSATDSCQHISCRGYLRHFVIFIIHDFSALSWLMLSTGH